MIARTAWMTGLLLLMTAPPAWAEEIPIAVMEFASKGGVTQKQMDALGDFLANEIREMGQFRVIGKSDIRAALDLEQQKTLVGCNDASCIAEVGGALGVRWVVVGNVSKFGETFLLNLKVLDVEKIRVAKGLSKKVEGGESKLIDALTEGAKELIAGARIGEKLAEEAKPEQKPAPEGTAKTAEEKKPEAKTAAVTPPEDKPEPPGMPPPAEPPTVTAEAPGSAMNTWGHATFWSGVGFTAVGGLFMLMAMSEADVYSDTREATPDRLSALDTSETYTGVMWVGYAAGIVLMGTGLTLWLLDAYSGDDTSVGAAAAPTADGHGMVLTVGGRW